MMGPSAPAAFGVNTFLDRDSFDFAIELKLDLELLEDKCSSKAGSCLRTRQNSLIFLEKIEYFFKKIGFFRSIFPHF